MGEVKGLPIRSILLFEFLSPSGKQGTLLSVSNPEGLLSFLSRFYADCPTEFNSIQLWVQEPVDGNVLFLAIVFILDEDHALLYPIRYSGCYMICEEATNV